MYAARRRILKSTQLMFRRHRHTIRNDRDRGSTVGTLFAFSRARDRGTNRARPIDSLIDFRTSSFRSSVNSIKSREMIELVTQ